jgi:beta-phosphoglucomutase-like phosphatase (HAD superfamily)
VFAAAIFDMDGLLLDSERYLMNAWLAAAREFGHTLSEEQFLYTVGRNRIESHVWLRGIFGSDFDPLWARVLELVGAEEGTVFPLKAGAVEILAALAAMRTPCAVASSTASPEIRRRLAAVGVLQHFRAVVGSDEVARGKPDPAVYALAAQRLGVDPSSCLAFEDSQNGARAALAAGMQVVVIPDLKRPDVDGVLAELPTLFAAVPHLPDWFPV